MSYVTYFVNRNVHSHNREMGYGDARAVRDGGPAYLCGCG